MMLLNNRSIAIVGWHDSAAGQIHSWFLQSNQYEVACFVNPSDEVLEIDPSKIQRDVRQFSYPEGDYFRGLPLIHSAKWCECLKNIGIHKVLITTPNALERYEQIQLAKLAGFELINAIHPSVLIMDDVILEDNIILYPRVFIGYRAELFSGVFINTGAQIEHHNVIRECVTIDPGVIFAGNVTIDSFAHIHTGVVIKNRIRVGKSSVLGAGCVVIKDVPQKVTMVGVPARIVKCHD